MHFDTKNYLKNNRHHTAKHTIRYDTSLVFVTIIINLGLSCFEYKG